MSHCVREEPLDPRDPRIREAVRTMELAIGDDLIIADVAAAAGMSLHHFHRLFLAEMGEPPAAFLRRLRLDAAALRLQWTDEPGVEIAQAFRYDSRSAFIRAFGRRFGTTPAEFRRRHRVVSRLATFDITGRRVTLHELGSFRLLARRYVGDPFQLSKFWADFASLLPEHLMAGKRLFVGLLYDDPEISGLDQVRYDCGVTIGEWDDAGAALAAPGLRLLNTHAGRYGGIEHSGPPETVAQSYGLLQHHWFRPQGLVPGNEPAIEIHSVARHLQDRSDLRFTIMVPVEL